MAWQIQCKSGFCEAIVFVVPQTVAADEFPVQNFVAARIFDGGLSQVEIDDSACDMIDGIGDEIMDRLRDMGISTIGELLVEKANNPEGISFLRTKIADFEMNLEYLKHKQQVETIKQYILCLPYKVNTVEDMFDQLTNMGLR